jgi:hypothetical protein
VPLGALGRRQPKVASDQRQVDVARRVDQRELAFVVSVRSRVTCHTLD